MQSTGLEWWLTMLTKCIADFEQAFFPTGHLAWTKRRKVDYCRLLQG